MMIVCDDPGREERKRAGKVRSCIRMMKFGFAPGCFWERLTTIRITSFRILDRRYYYMNMQSRGATL